MAKRKRIPKRKNAPILIPVVAALGKIAWAKVGTAVLVGTLGLAGGLAAYQWYTTEDYSPQYKDAVKDAKELLQYGLEGGTDPKYKSTTPALLSTPTNLYFAYAMIAFFAARAGITSQEPAFFQLSQEYLDKIGFFAPSDFENNAVIAQALQEAVNKMNSFPNSTSAQIWINKVAQHADPLLVQAEKNTQERLALDPLEPWRETVADATKPITLAAGLISGKCPTGWDCATFRKVQIAIYSLAALTVYNTVRDFVPKGRTRKGRR